jgi:hypothetical protein
MAHRYRTIAVSALALAAGAAAIALAGPVVTTGSMSVAGSGYGTVTVQGDVWAFGSIGGGGQIEVRTNHTGAIIGVGGRSMRVGPHRDVVVYVGTGRQFGVSANAGSFWVAVRGRWISETLVGAGRIVFTGRGTYTYGYGSRQVVTRPWPRVPVQLRQAGDRRAHGMVPRTPVARPSEAA